MNADGVPFNAGAELVSTAPCGCHVYVLDDQLHAMACAPIHYSLVDHVARQMSTKYGFEIAAVTP
jgi:hypothetical protein